jgi:hypothetical protein
MHRRRAQGETSAEYLYDIRARSNAAIAFEAPGLSGWMQITLDAVVAAAATKLGLRVGPRASASTESAPANDNEILRPGPSIYSKVPLRQLENVGLVFLL